METATTYPRAATRSWLEINVRPWLAVTLLMAGALVALTLIQYRDAQRARRLIQQGTIVKDAEVGRINDRDRNMPRNESLRVEMKYAHPTTGSPLIAPGMLSRKPGASVSLGDRIDLRVDPQNPLIWTDRSEVPPLTRELAVPLLLLPVVLLSFGAAWWQRARVRRTLATGTLTQGTVVAIKQTPLAPMSKQIGITVESIGPRVRQAYWPTRNGLIGNGDRIDVVASDAMVLPVRSYR